MIPWHRDKRWTDALYINESLVFDTLIHYSVLDFITGFLVETSHCGIVYEQLSERKTTYEISVYPEWWLYLVDSDKNTDKNT
jgi:hypothetical protein